MQGQPRKDREWEHWPGRRPPDDRLRHRLRSLFVPTDGSEEAEVEALIAERDREIEERTNQLAATIADLERREDQAGRLRIAVEEMLRHGSAELDDRHAGLNALATELRAREETLSGAERDVAERKRELGAVELHRAAVERREAALTERESTLQRIADELTGRERQLADAEQKVAALVAREAELDARDERLTQQEAELEELRVALAAAEATVEQREHAVGDLEVRKQALEELAASLAAREAAITNEQAAIASGRDELTRAVATVSTGLRLAGAPAPGAAGASSHLLFLPGDAYRLVEVDGDPPVLGAEIEAEDGSYRVVRVGRSPLPDDRRACAFLELR